MQHRVSGYEWSDGTKFDYYPTISDEGDVPACVFIDPTGNWMDIGCDTKLEGAICYTTNITTSSQSKTPTCLCRLVLL